MLRTSEGYERLLQERLHQVRVDAALVRASVLHPLLLLLRRRRCRGGRHGRGRRRRRAHPRGQREAPLELGALGGALHPPRLVRVALQAEVLLHVLGPALCGVRRRLLLVRAASASTGAAEQQLRVVRAPGEGGEEGQPVRPPEVAVGSLPAARPHRLLLVLLVHVRRLAAAMVRWREVEHVALVLLAARERRHRARGRRVERGRGAWREERRRARGRRELRRLVARPVEELRRGARGSRRRLLERERRRRRGPPRGGEELGEEEARLVAQRLEHVSHPQHEVQVLGYNLARTQLQEAMPRLDHSYGLDA